MIVPWLVVSIFASIFLEMFANVEFRNSFWSKLGLDALGLKLNGDEFLWICKNGYDKSVERMLRSSDSSVLNKKDTDDSDKSGLHISWESKKVEVVKVLIKHPSRKPTICWNNWTQWSPDSN